MASTWGAGRNELKRVSAATRVLSPPQRCRISRVMGHSSGVQGSEFRMDGLGHGVLGFKVGGQTNPASGTR